MDQNATPSVADMFAQVFQAKNQFPRWFQPHPNIGQILVHSQAEEDELKARDWTPKPLPGSEVVKANVKTIEDVSNALETLQAERDLFEAQKAAFMAQLEARLADVGAPVAAPVAAPAPSGATTSAVQADAAAQVAGGLSDTSVDTPAAAPKAPAAAAKK